MFGLGAHSYCYTFVLLLLGGGWSKEVLAKAVLAEVPNQVSTKVVLAEVPNQVSTKVVLAEVPNLVKTS